MEIKRQKAEEQFKNVITVGISQFKLKFQQEFITFYRKITKIKRNLAMISIGKIWRKRKLNYKNFKEKIHKVKRRINATKAKEAYELQLSLASQKNDEFNPLREDRNPNDEEIDNILDDKMKKIQKEKERSRRIFENNMNRSKLSYKISDFKLQSYSPFLMVLSESGELEDEEDDKKESFKQTNATISYIAKMKSRAPSFDSRRTQISPPIRLEHKKFYNSKFNCDYFSVPSCTYETKQSPIKIPAILGNANFTKHTFSYSTSVNPMQYPILSKRPIRSRREFNPKDTISYSLKRREIVQTSKSPDWKLSMKPNEYYLPSINNMSYTPSPCLPSRVPSNILSTNADSKVHSKLSLHYNKNHWSSSLLSASPSSFDI